MNFNFTPFPLIETERLRLRELTFEDVETIYNLRTYKKINQYITRNIPKNLSEANQFIQMILELVAKNKAVLWVIDLKETNQLIGTIGLRHFDVAPDYAEIGYELNPDFQQKAFMSEALESVLHFGFQTLHLKTIEAITHKNNMASIALLKKYLFVFQAQKRDKGFKNNRIFQRTN